MNFSNKEPFYVIIAGGRDFSDYKLLKESMDILLTYFKDVTIISGAAKGADSLGEVYAKEKGYNLIKCPANWDKYGKSAGYIRNCDMANIIQDSNNGICVCFWDEKSKGTKHMIDIAKSKKIETYIINY
jgi:hypothetical protein